MPILKTLGLTISVFSLLSQSALAARQCEAPPLQDKRAVRKLNVESNAFYTFQSKDFRGEEAFKPTIIASITKILVTRWALGVLPGNHNFRFEMELFVTPTAGGRYNVHIAGHNYPDFDRPKLDAIFKYLQGKGVVKIDQLSFDENTKYIHDWSALNSKAIQGDDLDYPSSQTMAANLDQYKRSMKGGSFQSFRFLRSAEFAPRKRSAKRHTTVSPPLLEVLRSMNERSNNHVANQIFNYLGGASAFRRFAVAHFNCGPAACSASTIRIYNGSGSPMKLNGEFVLANGRKIYNKAPGAVVVQSLAYIYSYVKAAKLKLSDIMSVNDAHEQNHLTKWYASRCWLEGNVAAKTGTVFEAVSLAGFLSTRDRGPIAFYFNIDTETPADYNNAKEEIRAYLTGLTRAFGQGPDFD